MILTKLYQLKACYPLKTVFWLKQQCLKLMKDLTDTENDCTDFDLVTFVFISNLPTLSKPNIHYNSIIHSYSPIPYLEFLCYTLYYLANIFFLQTFIKSKATESNTELPMDTVQ